MNIKRKLVSQLVKDLRKENSLLIKELGLFRGEIANFVTLVIMLKSLVDGNFVTLTKDDEKTRQEWKIITEALDAIVDLYVGYDSGANVEPVKEMSNE